MNTLLGEIGEYMDYLNRMDAWTVERASCIWFSPGYLSVSSSSPSSHP